MIVTLNNKDAASVAAGLSILGTGGFLIESMVVAVVVYHLCEPLARAIADRLSGEYYIRQSLQGII